MSILDRFEGVRTLEGSARLKLLSGLLVAMIVSFCTVSQAAAETRSLKLFFIHTKERAEIVYKRNGRYDQRGIKEINRFLRDWRRNEHANMDPRLLDLVWEVYRAVGARDYIHVVSAYRSPATNASLRKRSSGVAQKSQHMLGKAMDFYIPGVPLSKLRAAAFKAHGGGVGYYPKSGAPFVHLDVGNVRSWPRMSRSELLALFPDGRTMHLPADGKPLPGYNQALAAYQSRQRSGGSVQIASASSGSGSRSGGFLANLLRGGGADEEEDVEVAAAPAPAPVRQRQQDVQSEPQRQERGTIIAALPERDAPLPGVAPRPIVDIGAPAAAPLIAGLPSQSAPAPTAAAVIEMAALPARVPLPAQRPDLAPAAPVQVAAAPVDLPVSAIAPERPKRGGSEAISDMLALSAADARADVVINPPVPALRPLSTQPAGEVKQVAAISSEQGGDVFALAALPDASAPAARDALAEAIVERAAPIPPKDGRMASLSASPRVAMLSRQEGADAAAALDSGVRTTAKAAKPRGVARAEPKPVVVPVQRELTRWAFQSDVTVATAGGVKQRSAAHEVVWSAPRTVYTDGFKRDAKPAEVNRFTGNAVTFLSVARFEDKN